MHDQAQINPQRTIRTSEYKKLLCPFCKSEKITKWCKRKTKNGIKQRYKCNKCSKCFTREDGFFRMKKTKQLITASLNLYFSGMSLRKVKEHILQFTPQGVSHMSVWRWLIKYSKMIRNFTEKLQPNVSGVFHADEIFINCKGEQNYFWDMVDKDTRFLVTTHYSTKRNYQSARRFFLKTKQKPLVLFTDRLAGYNKAYRRVWGANKRSQDKKVHIRLKADKDKRNNIIERIQGTIRERVKVMRAFKATYSAEAILSLFVVWYNFIRVHQGINVTPAQRAGLDLKLKQNKWLSLIELSY